MTDEEKYELVEKTAESLGEHFDAVQILVTWNEEGQTKKLAIGAGNWYARQGMAHEFITSDIAQDNARQIADQLRQDDPPDDWKAQGA